MFELITKDTTRQEAQRLLDAALRLLEPRVAAAFRKAAEQIRDGVVLEQLAEAIAANDIVRAIVLAGAEQLGAALTGQGLPPGQASVLDELVQATRLGADSGMRMLPRQAGLMASLDLTNPESLRYLREHIPELVTWVTDDVRKIIGETILRGHTEGRPVVQMARDIRDSIGLTPDMAAAVRNFRMQLLTGEPWAGKLPWERRLSAADRARARRIYEQGGATFTRIDSIVERYYRSLLNRRALNIARTESHRAFIEGQQNIWRQAAARGFIDSNLTRRMWIVTPDDRLRPDHAAIPGMNPNGVGLTEPFQTPFGPVMGPGDGVPQLINCRCTVALEFKE